MWTSSKWFPTLPYSEDRQGTRHRNSARLLRRADEVIVEIQGREFIEHWRSYAAGLCRIAALSRAITLDCRRALILCPTLRRRPICADLHPTLPAAQVGTGDRLIVGLTECTLRAHAAVWQEYLRLHNAGGRSSWPGRAVWRLVGISGVGPIIALAFKTTVDDSRRFRQVGEPTLG
jgi:hypothetical protein